jgi:hypothetical protein
MSSVRLRAQCATSSLRWLILASLGYVAPSACGGRAGDPDRAATDGDSGPTAAQAGGNGLFTSGRGGGAGGSTGTTGGSGDAMGGAVAPPTTPGIHRACDLPTPLGGGYERCADGVVHRPVAGVCPSALPRAAPFSQAQLVEFNQIAAENALTWQRQELLPCTEDSECSAEPRGYCELYAEGPWSGFFPLTQCRYGCQSDSDCGQQQVCTCGSPIGTCSKASCQSDGDCPGALHCAQYDASYGCDPTLLPAFACETADDACSIDADCQGDPCIFNGSRRQCRVRTCDL